MLRQLAIIALTLTPPFGLAQMPDSNADLNGDVMTNSLDFSILASCFGQEPATNNACTVADVDADGDIDVDDFVFVAARFGQAYPWKLYSLPKFIAGENPQSVTLGDVNGDGLLDLAVANSGSFFASGDVSVLLGNGDGSYQEQQHFAAGDRPRSVALGDLNGDGLLDLAVANSGSGDVSVLLGNGDGSFQDQRRFAASASSTSIALGDLNGDGVLDLAVPDALLLGNGDGSFQEQQLLATGDSPRSVALGDVDGDGVLDLAVANSGFFSDGDVSVLLGNGDGSFQDQRRFATGDVSSSVALGDVNGDGLLDLAVANWDNNNVSVLLGNGGGSFQTQRRFSAGDEPSY